MDYPSAEECYLPDMEMIPAKVDQTTLDAGMFQLVKDLHVQVENYMKALPVNEKSIAESVDQIVALDFPLLAKFSKVNVVDLIKRNKNIKGKDSLSTLASALGYLEKYGRNLLKPERPTLWKCIYFANSVFRIRVDIIKGARDVLKLMGYSEVVEEGLSFPPDQDSPSLDLIAIVTADLAIAKREIELFTLGHHPYAYRVQDCLDGAIAMIQVSPYSPSGQPHNIFLRRPAHGVRTIYENVALGPPPAADVAGRGRATEDGGRRVAEMDPGVPWVVPAVAPAPTNPFASPPKPASQPEGIVRRIGEPVPSAAPAKPDVGLGYFADSNGTSPPVQDAAPSTALQSVAFPSPRVSRVPAISKDKTIECVMCGKAAAKVQCTSCSGLRCESCDSQWHLHPNRRSHQRRALDPPQPTDATTPSQPLPPVLLCDVCGVRPSSLVCVDCSSSSRDGWYCSPCDAVFHGHPVRQGHSRRPLGLAATDPADKPLPEKHIVLSPVSSQDASKLAEPSPAPCKKRPVPTPRRYSRNKDQLAPAELLIPEDKPLSDDVFTPAEPVPTQLDIKRPPSDQPAPQRSQSDSQLGAPASSKPYHSLPASKREIMSEIEAIVKRDIGILQKIQTDRDLLMSYQRGSPMYETMEAEISRLTGEHEKLLTRQQELESLTGRAASSEVAADRETSQEQPEVKYPPAKDYKVPPSQHATVPAAASTNYPPADSAARLQPPSVTGTPTVAVRNPPEASAPSAGGVPQPVKRSSIGRAPANASQAASAAWVCQQCGDHNAPSPPDAACATCHSPQRASQLPSVAALRQQLGRTLQMAAPCPQPQPGASQMNAAAAAATGQAATPRPGEPATAAGTSAMPSRSQPAQAKPVSVFTYLQMEEEAMLKEKQRAKREHDLQMVAQKDPKPKTPSPLPRRRNEEKRTQELAVGRTPPVPSMRPSQDDIHFMPHVMDISAAIHPISPGRSHVMSLEDKKRIDEQRSQSLAFIQLLKEAEMAGYFPEEVVAAAQQMQRNDDGTANELQWLRKNWDDYVSTVSTMATNHLKEELGKSFGMVRSQDASRALREHCGNVKKAVAGCVAEMQQRVLSLVELDFSHRRVCELLSSCDGGVSTVLVKLQQERAAEFVARIWAPENPAYQQKQVVDHGVRRDNESQERRRRILLAEYDLPSWGRAETAATLIDKNKYDFEDAIMAAIQCGDLERAKHYLEKNCQVCYSEFPMNKLSTLSYCQCKICSECLKDYFHEIITNQNIMKAACPVCDKPDLRRYESEAMDYFGFLDSLLKGILDDPSYQLFQTKLRDWNLMKEDNFRWCAHCGNGFINGAPERRKMRCHECNKVTCFKCKKAWMEQHENISCADFQKWKEANDPNRQAEGLAIHLKENGIDCPNCKMRYELAKGGCMHFKCVQCIFEFCCGCSSPFKKANECGRFASCVHRGLHAHHPRDCLFYLRDQDIKSLQKLLQKHDVDYKRNNPLANPQQVCSVKEQKDGPDGLEDAECGREVVQQTGLCNLHYTEYLVSMINQNHIDPADEYTGADLTIILKRNALDVPPRAGKETEGAYRTRLLKEVKAKLPLEKVNPRDRHRAQSL